MADSLVYLSLFIIWMMLFYHMYLMQGGYLFSLRLSQLDQDLFHDVPSLPMVSILIPAHNEEMVIEETILSMLSIIYPKHKLEVIIINDNSSDETGIIADEYASTYPWLKVIHTKPPLGGKGKSRALNLGFQQSQGDIIIVYDADNNPEADAVLNLVVPLLKDEKAGAIVGKFRVINSTKNLLTRFINIETITFQWLAQAGRWFWFHMTTIPGTNFAIRRSILEELGGWDERALSEDTELSIRVYNLGYHIQFFPNAVTWEQEPERWKVWWKQRTRWARGNIYVIGKYLKEFSQLKRKKVYVDLLYFLLTYFLFFAGILTSHIILITNLWVDLDLSIGIVSYILLIVGFLLFVTEILLALSMEHKQLSFINVFVVFLMYFTYSQIWLVLILYSIILEFKRIIFKEEAKWYKTERFKKGSKENH